MITGACQFVNVNMGRFLKYTQLHCTLTSNYVHAQYARYFTQTAMAAFDDIKTFIFFDLETTGLPHLENNRTRITELSMIAVESEHIGLGVFPRVQNKLTLMFNPRKLMAKEAENITGLNNLLLESQSEFQPSTVALINQFFSLQRSPLCLVAHNGKRFDFPIFKAEIERTGCKLEEGILYVDSLEAFRQLHLVEEEKPLPPTKEIPLELQDDYDEILVRAVEQLENQEYTAALAQKKINETTPRQQIIASNTKCDSVVNGSRRKLNFGLSFKLCDVYQRLTAKTANDAHRAEGDVNMLIECAATLGDRFVFWANQHAGRFSEIKAMKPGTPIGK